MRFLSMASPWPDSIGSCVDRIAAAATRWCIYLAAALFLSAPVHAVHVSPSGTGEALIVPLYTTEGGFDTLLEVANTRESRMHAVALKANFVSESGDVAATLNVYLRAAGSWALALAGNEDGGATASVVDGCTLAAGPDDAVAAVDSFDLGSARNGYIEIVEMGQLVDVDLRDALYGPDCDAFADYWNNVISLGDDPDSVLAPPPGAIRAGASLVNVSRGTMYSVPATPLANFRTVEWHSPPAQATPDLSSAHNDALVTTSLNCFASPCIADEWDDPVDAVSAALMVYKMTGGYVISEQIEARTEWVLTAPMLRHAEEESAEELEHAAFFLYFDRNGDALANVVPLPPPPFNQFSMNDHASITESVLSMPIGHKHDDRDPSQARILAITPGAGRSPFDSGSVRVGLGGKGAPLMSLAGNEYRGRPVIGIILQEFNNGMLVDDAGRSRVASYGNVFLPGRTMERAE